jgi:hypothetical protein
MNLPTCSLWILVARTDIAFMMFTIPHLVKMSNFPFTERVLVIDTAPLSGDKINRPGVGTMEKLRENTQELLEKGIVDRVLNINYDSNYRNQVYQKHFGFPLKQTHNYKGYPILGTIFTIEEPNSDYMLHFDSDMLLYQQADFNWIEEAMKLSEKHPEIMSFRPLTGPPSVDGTLYQQKNYQYDTDGFYKFKFFGSRVYLINKKTFDQILPLPIVWRAYKQKFFNNLPNNLQTLLNYTFNKGKLDSWEIMVSKKLENTEFWRGVLADKRAWTLHPKDRSPAFIQALPDIIKRIEAGEYPEEQAGHYDLISELWY